MSLTDCPEDSALQDYLSGRLAATDIDEIDQHVAGCSTCELSMGRFEDAPDTLVTLLQSEETDAEYDARSSVRGAATELPQVDGEVASYQLIEKLGSGGMGRVYLARHKKLDKQVAIKLLPRLDGCEREFVARFEREMRAAGQLEHSAIVRSTDAGEHEGVHYLVMEAIDGLDLSRVAQAVGRLNIGAACEVARQAACGLAYAHQMGIVHRDVKPSNLMLDNDGRVRILDFGLAQTDLWEKESAEITTVGQLMGTLDYMAPEQAERGGVVDYRADLYSLGATLFRLLAGRAPLAAAPDLTPLEKLRLLATHTAPRLSTLRDDLPAGLEPLISSLLSRDPSARPASASHVAEALEPYCEPESLPSLLKSASVQPGQQQTWKSSARQSILPIGPAVESKKGRGVFWPIVAVGLAGLLAVAGILFVVETSKGQLVIDSKDANVSVKLRRDGRIAEELTIRPGKQGIKLWSGKYEFEIDSPGDRFTVSNDKFQILRGEIVVAEILPIAEDSRDTVMGESSPSVSLEDLPDQRLNAIVYKGQTLDVWLARLRFEKEPSERTAALLAIKTLASPELRDLIEPVLREYNLQGDHAATQRTNLVETLYKVHAQDVLAFRDIFEDQSAQTRSQLASVIARQGWADDFDDEADAYFTRWALDNLRTDSDSSGSISLLRRLCCYRQSDEQVRGSLRRVALYEAERPRVAERLRNIFWFSSAAPDASSVAAGRSTSWHSTSWHPEFRSQVLKRCVDEVGTTDNLKTRVRAWLVLRSLKDDAPGIDEIKRAEMADAVRRVINDAGGPGWEPQLVAFDTRSLTRYAAIEGTNGPVSCAELSPVLNVCEEFGVVDVCRTDLEALYARLAEFPLYTNTRIRRIVGPKLLSQTVSSPVGQFYIRTGVLLGLSEQEIMARFHECRASDNQLLLEQAVVLFEQGDIRSLETIDKLLPRERNPRIDRACTKIIARSTRSGNLLYRVLLRASGDQFFEKLAAGLSARTRGGELPDLSRLSDLNCSSVEQLKPLLDWANQQFGRQLSAQERSQVALLLRSLLITRPRIGGDAEQTGEVVPAIGKECQAAILELLLQQPSLSNEQFWLAYPASAGPKIPGFAADKLLRSEILRRSLLELSRSESRRIRCQALACLRSSLSGDTLLSSEQQEAFVDYFRRRIPTWVADMDACATSESLGSQFVKWFQPQLPDPVELSSYGLSVEVANEALMALQLVDELGVRSLLKEEITSLYDASKKTLPKMNLGTALEQHRLTAVMLNEPGELKLLIHFLSGVLVGRDLKELLSEPGEIEKMKAATVFQQVLPGDTLAVYVEDVLPRRGAPMPVMQAGNRNPVTGYPVPVNAVGEIVLPIIGRFPVIGKNVDEVQTQLAKAFLDRRILVQANVSVAMLSKANSRETIRSLTNTPTETSPAKAASPGE